MGPTQAYPSFCKYTSVSLKIRSALCKSALMGIMMMVIVMVITLIAMAVLRRKQRKKWWRWCWQLQDDDHCHHFSSDNCQKSKNQVCITLFNIYSFHRYHLGTIAFGSLILAVIKIIRYLIDYIQVRLKGTSNQFARYTLKCLKCLFCFRFLKFLNKNAYIEVCWNFSYTSCILHVWPVMAA